MEPLVKVSLKSRLPLVGLILVLPLALLLPGQIWSMLLAGYGGLMLIAYFWAHLLARSLRGSRQLRFGWVAVGDRLSEQFEIRNDGELAVIWVELSDESNVPGYQSSVVRSVGARQTDRWRHSAVCQQRGRYRLGPWALHSGDPFGFFRVTISYPSSDEIVIHPPIHAEIPITLPAGQRSGRVRTRDRRWEATSNAATVRNYQPQDPLRWIHWPTSARRDELFVRQFEADAAGEVWLVLDLQREVQLGDGAEGTEEHAVILAAALTAQGQQQQRAIGLATYGEQPRLIPPGRGKHQQWKLLQALALADADGNNDLAIALRDLGEIAQRGSAAVIITANGRGDWLPELLHLSQRGIQSHVALFDRASFGSDSAVDDSLSLRDAIRRLGLQCTLIKQGEIGRPALEQERHGYWEFMVTGTGRVITVRSPFQA
jgi:uncharacterized protein (DUF58 family)